MSPTGTQNPATVSVVWTGSGVRLVSGVLDISVSVLKLHI